MSASTVDDNDIHKQLAIKDVLAENVEPSKDLLYCSPLKKDTLKSIKNLQQDINSENSTCTIISTTIDKISPTLDSTNSNRFSSNTQAVKDVEEVNSQVKDLSSAISKINISKIESVIEEYNDKLKKLKKKSKYKVLKEAADIFNAKKKQWDGYPKPKTYDTRKSPSSPYYDAEFNYCQPKDANTEEYEIKFISGTPIDDSVKDQDGNIVSPASGYSMDIYQINKYKQIKYWRGIKNIQLIPDESITEIEEMFEKVGEKLPYDKEKIIGDVSGGNGFFGT